MIHSSQIENRTDVVAALAGSGCPLGWSAAVRSLVAAAIQIAPTNVPLTISGEAGTEKREVAMWLHELSRPIESPCGIAICAKLKGDDVRRMMAVSDSREGSTLVLDEMCELSAAGQKALVEHLSAKLDDASGVRVIGCTSFDIVSEVEAGRFREDLSYLMSACVLRIPPLRQRRGDIPVIASQLLGKYSKLLGREGLKIGPRMRRLFEEYDWPGNTVELEDAIRLLAATNDERVAIAAIQARTDGAAALEQGKEIVPLKQVGRAASRAAEREAIMRTLWYTKWNRKRAAQELQISYKALLYKLKEFGVGSTVGPSTGES